MSKRIGLVGLAIGVLVAVGVALWLTRGGDSSAALSTKDVPLTELGVRIKVPQSIASVTYRVEQVQALGPVLFMRTPDLPEGCAVGVFYRLQKSAVVPGAQWTPETVEAATKQQGDVPPRAKAFNDFYLVFEPSQAACSADQAAIDHEVQVRQDIWSSVQTAKLL
jgi:hypothetical protein